MHKKNVKLLTLIFLYQTNLKIALQYSEETQIYKMITRFYQLFSHGGKTKTIYDYEQNTSKLKTKRVGNVNEISFFILIQYFYSKIKKV